MAKASDNEFPKLILVEGSAPTSPPAGRQDLFIDSADHKVKRVDSSGTVTTIEGGGSSSGGIIAVHSYSPATQQTYSPTSSTYVDMDATNLAVTFVAPTSGKVMIQTEIGYSCAGGSLLSIDLREGTSDLAGTQRVAANISSGVGLIQGSVAPLWIISGLTAGSTHTYKLGMSRLSGTAGVQFIIDPTSVWGDVHIVVTEAP
jgi:hypothetical protein